MADDQPPPLTDKQTLFIAKYFELGMNGTRAAIAAGYSKKNARQMASENLSKPYIRAEINRLLKERVMGSDEVLARLADQARGDMRDFIGKSARALARHPEGHLIKKIEHTLTTSTDKDGEATTEEKIKIELYDAQAALVHIGRHHGLFTDKTDLTTGGKPIEFADAHENLARLVARHVERGGAADVDSEPDAGAGGSPAV